MTTQKAVPPTIPCPDGPSKKRKAELDEVNPRQAWNVRLGKRAAGIRNPIREIMDTIGGKENPSKRVISLAQGDPTTYPHLRPGPEMIGAVASVFADGLDHGYQPSQGNGPCRKALAEYFSIPGKPLAPTDVFMTVGTSEALSHCVAALGAEGSNMLVPRPGFPLYQVLCDFHGVEVRYYDLLADKDWEIDLEAMRDLVDAKTCALLVNNPSNPCGAVYSKSHLENVARFAEEMKLPIIADEVYAKMTLPGSAFHACASVSSLVPVLSVCAMSKRWLAPGWRLGWVTVHDNDEGVFKKAEVPDTILKLCQVSLGPSAPLQAAIPALLRNTPQQWYDDVAAHLKAQADCCVRRCRGVPGLEVASEPMGAMYFMVRIQPGALEESIGHNDVAFAGALLQEESVVILPGQCFEAPGFFRVVFAAPLHILEEAWDRIEGFCRSRAAKKA